MISKLKQRKYAAVDNYKFSPPLPA